MRTRWILRSGWFVAILIFGVSLAFLLTHSTPKRPEVTLKDGSVLRLECIRYKPKTAGALLFRWTEAARSWFATRFKRPVFDYRSAPPDSLVCWLSLEDPLTGPSVRMSPFWQRVAVDSHGCEFKTGSDNLSPMLGWPTGPNQFMDVFPNFPRRERQITLRFYDPQGELLGELKTPNPGYGHYSKWKPEPLPASRPLDDSNVTLVSFDNVWGRARFSSPRMGKLFVLTPEFRLPPNWELGDLDVLDATGNSGAPAWPSRFGPFHPHRFHPPGLPMTAQFAFCTNETAWSLSAKFFRTLDARFASNEVWTILNFPIPAAQVLRALTQSNRMQGVTIRLTSVAGAGKVTYSNGVPVSVAPFSRPQMGPPSGPRMAGPGGHVPPPVASEQAQFGLQVVGWDETLRVEAMLHRDAGATPCPLRMRSNDSFIFGLDAPPGTATLRLIVQRPQVREFYIQPKVRIAAEESGSPNNIYRMEPRLRPLRGRLEPALR